MTTSWLLLFLRCSLLSVPSCCNSLGVLLILIDSPVKDVVVLEALADKEISEDLPKVRIVGLIVEAKRTGVVQVDGELVGEAAAKDLSWGCHLLLHDSIVLLLLGCRLQSLPWQGAPAEVQHDVSKGFHIIPTRLFYTRSATVD